MALQPARLDGATIAVTGASSGIGFFAARELSRLGATIILVGRSADRSRAAMKAFDSPGRHRHVTADLSTRQSAVSAGKSLGTLPRLDGLVLNAGVIDSPARFERGDYGVEVTMGTNHLAHVEIFRGALPALARAQRARIVSVGSMLTARIPFTRDDWLSERRYRPRNAYALSKHATEIFGFELSRRLKESGIQSIVSHPGGAIDALTPNAPGLSPRSQAHQALIAAIRPLTRRLVQGKDDAARPAVAAAADPSLRGGEYVGPERTASGPPVVTTPTPTSVDPELGQWLWVQTEAILGGRILG